ncbi:MAG: hypothetical protein WC455_13275 [Dehalococcoidia bacterium]
MTDKAFIEVECGSCGGTGIYRGLAEPKGVGVVCLDCKGSGCTRLEYIPFTGRRRRHDINTVKLSRGRFICGPIGPHGQGVSYEDFLEGKIPTI